ncbi:serine hydrolase domain-containing protein [Hirschia litorea]|uniref:Serine hydrolase domain-containing protein n=1 Tax=Hirschia litorea TaxID=1199156 RepID=A0ABW2IND9_9PROT
MSRLGDISAFVSRVVLFTAVGVSFAIAGEADDGIETPSKPVATGELSAPTLAPRPPSLIDLNYVNARVEDLMKEDQMVGFAIAIVDRGEMSFVKGYGNVFPGGPQVNKDTVFRWASLSKGMAGTLAGILDNRGQMDLKAPVSNYKTTLRLPANGTAKVKVEDLLSHQLGIVPNAYDTRLEDGVDPQIIRKDLGKLKNICPPADCHSYQNVAFDAISEIAADVTGKSYQELVTENILQPLGMTSASLTREELIQSGNYAFPFGYSRGISMVAPVELNDNYYKVPAAGGMNSSIEDLARYMQAQMGLAPNVLPPEVLDKIHAPKAATWKERNRMRRQSSHITHADYALGWRVYDYEGRKLVGHRGAVRGYRAMILFDPELDTGIAALWNSSTSMPVGLQFEVMDMAYGLEPQKWMKLSSQGEDELTTSGD